MQTVVKWWCELIGITDAVAVQTATGVVAGGTALAIVWLALSIALLILNILGSARD